MRFEPHFEQVEADEHVEQPVGHVAQGAPLSPPPKKPFPQLQHIAAKNGYAMHVVHPGITIPQAWQVFAVAFGNVLSGQAQ